MEVATQIHNVIVVGGSGTVGLVLVKVLIERGYAVKVVIRESSSACVPAGIPVVWAPDNYDERCMTELFQGVDAVVLCLAGGSHMFHSALVKASINARVKRLIASTYCTHNGWASNSNHSARIHNTIHADLRSREQPGWSWSSIHCGMLVDLFVGPNDPVPPRAEQMSYLLCDGDYRFSASTRRVVGIAVANVLRELSATENRSVFISSMEVSMNEICAAYKKVTGNEEPRSAHIRTGRKRVGMVDLLAYELCSSFSQMSKADNEILGIPEESLDDVVCEKLAECQTNHSLLRSD